MRVSAFGKIMARLNPEDCNRFVLADKAEAHVDGNVKGGVVAMRRVFLLGAALVAATAQASVENWLDACERELDVMHGFVLRQHGRVIAEGTWKPFDTLNEPHMLYSHSKSFTSTAVGFLVDAGKLDLDERVIDILADKAPSTPSENLRSLRVRDLLTMNMGASRTDAEGDDPGGDWAKALLANTFDVKPGTRFRYDSGATYLLSCIVERRSGRRLMDLLAARLFEPIGITKAWSTVSPTGTACGGWGMYMTTRELSLFGQLYLQKGLWNGKRILSEEWVTMASARQTWSGAIGVTGEDGGDWRQGYGFQFWRCRHGFYRADGANGQLTIVMPQHDAVLSVNAGLEDMQKEMNLIWQHILPVLEGREPVTAATHARCAALSIPALAGVREGAEPFCNRTFALSDNLHGIRSLLLQATDGGWTCRMVTSAGTFAIPVGFGDWRRGELRFSDATHETLRSLVGTHRLASSAAVQPDGSLKLRMLFVNAPQKFDLTFKMTKDGPVISGRLIGLGGCKLASAGKKVALQAR